MQMRKYFNMLISIYPPPTSFNHSAYLYYKMYIYFNKPSYRFFILSKKKVLNIVKLLAIVIGTSSFNPSLVTKDVYMMEPHVTCPAKGVFRSHKEKIEACLLLLPQEINKNLLNLPLSLRISKYVS